MENTEANFGEQINVTTNVTSNLKSYKFRDFDIIRDLTTEETNQSQRTSHSNTSKKSRRHKGYVLLSYCV